jgi:hypothetical protein
VLAASRGGTKEAERPEQDGSKYVERGKQHEAGQPEQREDEARPRRRRTPPVRDAERDEPQGQAEKADDIHGVVHATPGGSLFQGDKWSDAEVQAQQDAGDTGDDSARDADGRPTPATKSSHAAAPHEQCDAHDEVADAHGCEAEAELAGV